MDNNTPHLHESLNQLLESVRIFFRDSYDTKNNKWKTLDGTFRDMEENLAVVLIYDLLGEVEGFNAQHKQQDNNDKEKISFGTSLMNIAMEAVQQKGIDTQSINKVVEDISKHNPNSHGNDIPLEERVRIGRIAVLQGLDVLLSLLSDVNLTANLSTIVQEEFNKLYKILQHAKDLLSPGHTNPSVRDCVQQGIREVFKHEEQMPPSGDFDYVLILPEHPTDEFIQALKPLMMIMRWSIVVDSGFEDDPVYTTCHQLNSVGIANTALTKQLSEVKTNWLFLNGRKPFTTKKEKELRQFFKELSRSVNQMKNLIVIDLTKDKETAETALLNIWQLFNSQSEEEPSDHTTVFSTIQDTVGDLEKKLSQANYDLTLVPLKISPTDFLSTLLTERLLPSDIGCGMNLNNLEYLSAGIKFLQSPNDEKSTIWDSFYSGRILSVKDMENNCDVYPRGEGRKLLRFSDDIKDALSSPDGGLFVLYHQPGAGGTSLARRLAYNFAQSCQNPDVLPVFLTKFDTLLTIDMLGKLSEAAGVRTTLLVIIDDKEINETEFQIINQNIIKKGIHCVRLRIRHILSDEDICERKNTYFLKSSIQDQNEIDRFDHKFKNAYASHMPGPSIDSSLSDIHSIYNQSNSVEMIYYPYTFCEQMNKENHDAVFAVPDSFVSKWFSSIQSEELKTLCGYIAIAYQFSASKAVDIYSLASVWRREGVDTLDAYNKGDLNALNKILKVSEEDYIGVAKSTLRAPRYAAFAEKILAAWKPAWKNQLSSLAVNFIQAMPFDLAERDQRLMMDIFIQQAPTFERDEDESHRKLQDRFSPLIGHILDNEGLDGAKSVFSALIERYPQDLFYHIHYARLLFEYAHSIKAEPEDANFQEAISVINSVLSKKDDFDSFHHIAGMYWRRVAKAKARIALQKVEYERVEFISDITDATDKALKHFEICNELNRGTSSYGYVSTSELIISTLHDIKKLLPPAKQTEMHDTEPYLSYLGVLDNTIQYLAQPLFSFEFANNNKLFLLRQDYLRLIGNTDKAIDESKRRFESVSDWDEKCIYGHRTVTLMIEQTRRRVDSQSRFHLYSNMDPNLLKELSTILKILSDSGDLRSAEQFFQLCRYTCHDQLTEGPTFNALKKWEGLAIEKNNQQQQLMASFYLYVCYAVKILNLENEFNKQLEIEYYKYREICRNLVERLNEESYSQVAFAGKEHINTWDCILDPHEAFILDTTRKRLYTDRCRRENARIIGMEGNQGDCEVRFLRKISFSRKGIVGDSVGLELKNGVIGFRYRGIGFYDFTSPKGAGMPSVSLLSPNKEKRDNNKYRNGIEHSPEITSGIPEKEKQTHVDEIYRTESEMSKLEHPKILGKIDLSKLQTKKKKGRK